MSKEIKRGDGGRWERGQSGNPQGKPRQDVHVRDLARDHTDESIKTLAKIMRSSRNDMARLRAAEVLLDRGFGRPTTHIETSSSIADEIDKIKRRNVPASTAAVVPLFPATIAAEEDDEK